MGGYWGVAGILGAVEYERTVLKVGAGLWGYWGMREWGCSRGCRGMGGRWGRGADVWGQWCVRQLGCSRWGKGYGSTGV